MGQNKRRVPTRDPPSLFFSLGFFVRLPRQLLVICPYSRGLRGLRLRDTHVSHDFVFPDLVDHKFKGRPRAACVEVDGLTDRAVLLLETHVVYIESNRELILLHIGIAKLNHEVANFGTIALAAKRELE